MPTANITISIEYTAGQLANLKEAFPNPDGSLPTSAELLVRVKSYLSNRLRDVYRQRVQEKAANEPVTDIICS